MRVRRGQHATGLFVSGAIRDRQAADAAAEVHFSAAVDLSGAAAADPDGLPEDAGPLRLEEQDAGELRPFLEQRPLRGLRSEGQLLQDHRHPKSANDDRPAAPGAGLPGRPQVQTHVLRAHRLRNGRSRIPLARTPRFRRVRHRYAILKPGRKRK